MNSVYIHCEHVHTMWACTLDVGMYTRYEHLLAVWDTFKFSVGFLYYNLLLHYCTAVPVPLFSAGLCPACRKTGVHSAESNFLVVTSFSKAHFYSVVTINGKLK